MGAGSWTVQVSEGSPFRGLGGIGITHNGAATWQNYTVSMSARGSGATLLFRQTPTGGYHGCGWSSGTLQVFTASGGQFARPASAPVSIDASAWNTLTATGLRSRK